MFSQGRETSCAAAACKKYPLGASLLDREDSNGKCYYGWNVLVGGGAKRCTLLLTIVMIVFAVLTAGCFFFVVGGMLYHTEDLLGETERRGLCFPPLNQ